MEARRLEREIKTQKTVSLLVFLFPPTYPSLDLRTTQIP